MPLWLAQQPTTLSDLELPFHYNIYLVRTKWKSLQSEDTIEKLNAISMQCAHVHTKINTLQPRAISAAAKLLVLDRCNLRCDPVDKTPLDQVGYSFFW